MMDDDTTTPITYPPCIAMVLNRRRFLRASGASAVGLAALGQAACEEAIVLNNVAPPAEPVAFSIMDTALSALQTVGEAAAFDTDEGLKLLLIRETEDVILAFNRTCTHSGLDILDSAAIPTPAPLWDGAARQLTCKWHNTVFDAGGAVVSGPAEVSLAVYSVTFDQATGAGEIQFMGSAAPMMSGDMG